MKKINYLIFAFTLLIFVSNCGGYKPIFGSSDLKFKIADFTLEGDKLLGKKIHSKLNALSKSSKNDPSARNVNLLINVSKDKKINTKDSTGKISEYKIVLKTKIKVTDFVTEDEILNQTFISSLTFKVHDQYSETIKLENKSIENLISKTYQELLIKLSQNISER